MDPGEVTAPCGSPARGRMARASEGGGETLSHTSLRVDTAAGAEPATDKELCHVPKFY